MSEKELWKDVPDFEDRYNVSNFGRVKRKEYKTNNGKILKEKELQVRVVQGYKVCKFFNSKVDKKGRHWKLSRLVAYLFVDGYKSGLVVNHINGNKLDNHYKNLEWCTVSQNTQHAYDTGLIKKPIGEKNPRSKLNEFNVLAIYTLRNRFTYKELSSHYSVSDSTIFDIFKKRTWNHILKDL